MAYTNNTYYNENIIIDEDGTLRCKTENKKIKDFKDYVILRNKLINSPVFTVKYDDNYELRPSCVKKFDALVQAYDFNIKESEKTIENFNWDLEQQIIIWRGGF